MSDTAATDRNVDALLSRGGELLQGGKVEGAQACFKDALELAPGHEKTMGLLGLTHFRLSDYDSASEIYEKLVEEYPQDASYRLNLGLVHLKLDLPEVAIVELAKSRQLDPSSVRTVSYLGLAYARNGEYELAYESFLEAEQGSLATEMEQYIDADQRQIIRDRLSDKSSSGEDVGAGKEIASVSYAETQVAIPGDGNEFELEGLAPKEEGIVNEEAPDSAPAASFEAGMVTQAVQAMRLAEDGSDDSAKPAPSVPQSLRTFLERRLVSPGQEGPAITVGVDGVLVARVVERLMCRTQGVIATSGALEFAPATRRLRGQQSDELFGRKEESMFVVTGQGYLLATPQQACFTALRLGGDVLYLREQCVFAFEPDLAWESGQIPGSDFYVVQFRGTGCVAIRSQRPMLAVQLTSERPVQVDADAFAGWSGKVVPRLVQPAAGSRTASPFVECSGEGSVLLHGGQGART